MLNLRLIPFTAGASLFLASASSTVFADKSFDYAAGAIVYNKVNLQTVSDTVGFSQSVDLDGDGDFDVIISGATYPSTGGASRGGQKGKILFNTGNNVFIEAEGDAPQSEHAREYIIRDFNNDGILDIYVADHGYDAAPFPGFPDQLLLGTGTGFSDVSNRLPNIAGFTHNGAAADIDADGDIDILSLNADSIAEELPYLLLNDGQANFTMDRSRLPASLVDTSQLKNSYSAELSDLDNDGYADLIIGRNQNTNLTPTRIHWNDGKGYFNDNSVTYLDEIDVFNNLETLTVIDIQGIDINGNGLNDLLVHAYNANGFTGTSIQLFINSGSRKFANETINRLGTAAVNSSSSTTVAALSTVLDINGDGILDLLMQNSSGTGDEQVFMFEGTGNGCFEAVTMAEVTSDQQARYRMGKLAMISSEEFGYAEFFTTNNNGQYSITSNYVPITISSRPAIDNSFHNCSGKLKFTVKLDNGETYTSDFSLISTNPEIIVQVDTASMKQIFEARSKPGVFNGATGKLFLPELIVDGQVFMRNLNFVVIDAEKLQLRLESYE
tara:strand:- start:118 stop:1779 length:1662 start_codon:yes stop_codon:yes gene_type:complete